MLNKSDMYSVQSKLYYSKWELLCKPKVEKFTVFMNHIVSFTLYRHYITSLYYTGTQVDVKILKYKSGRANDGRQKSAFNIFDFFCAENRQYALYSIIIPRSCFPWAVRAVIYHA